MENKYNNEKRVNGLNFSNLIRRRRIQKSNRADHQERVEKG